MRIGILETGTVNDALVPAHGVYPAMFERWLGAALPAAAFESWRVCDGVVPSDVAAADAWLVTGSKHGVYDDLPWIAPLGAFLVDARTARRPMIGVCFGHQILAQFWGGRAEKSAEGWGVGLRRYRIEARPGWMADAGSEIAIHAMHQDQVVAIPDDATVLASNEHCPFAMLAYGDPERPDAISIQPHPEFDEAYARDLVDIRRGLSFEDTIADAAMASFGPPTDAGAVARWAGAYLSRVSAGEPAT